MLKFVFNSSWLREGGRRNWSLIIAFTNDEQMDTPVAESVGENQDKGKNWKKNWFIVWLYFL